MDAAVQQQAQSVVVEVAKAVADALDLLHQQVHSLGGAVGEPGDVPGQDLGLPTTDGPSQTGELVDLGTAAVVAAMSMGTEACFEVGGSLLKGWNFRAIVQGSSVPQQMVPRLIGMWKNGQFPTEKLVKAYDFSDINTAFDDSFAPPRGLQAAPRRSGRW